MAGTEKQKRKSKSRPVATAVATVSDGEDDGDIMKDLPQKLVSYLMPFQKDGVLFAVRKDGRCLIADEMGLGKTLQAIAVASYFQSEWPLLIIVPSSLRYVWIEELEKWLPEILPHEINLIQGGFDTGGIADAKITIVTYGLLSCRSSGPVKEALKTQQFKIAICDESHYFKNSRTECCKAVTPLLTSATRCILLSGTPALAKPSELFTQLDALLPGKFGSFWSFTKKFCGGHWEYFGRRRLWKADGASSLEELQQRLQTVMIRREKNSVLSQLPPKQRQKILFALKDSSTKKEIVSIFAELKPLLKRSKSSLATNLLGGETTPVASPGPDGSHDAPQPDTNILSRIQQLYNLTGEAKIGPAREYIQMLCENANLKFLVFAYHHAMMDGLQQTLWDKKIKFVRIDGQTKPSDRQLYVQQFQSDKETRVAILSILAAGVGLTLTAASLVVFAELYWTPGMMVQCEDRAHRIGQTSTVPVHYLVARDTMDEWVWSAVCRKTIVTSTALTGRRQALQAEAGDRYQVELLSAADAYTPAEEDAEIDITQLIQSQRPRDQKSILDFFGSQSEPRDCSQSSTAPSTHHGASHIEDTEAGDETSDVLATPTRNNKGKKSFPLFTSLKNTSQSASKHQLSPDPVVIDSSDDEFQNTSGRARLNGVASAEKENNQRKQSVKQMKTGTSRKRKRVVNDPESKSDSEFEGDSSVLSPSVKKKQKKKKSGSESVPEAAPSHCKKREGGREQSSRPELEGGNRQPWACSSCTFSNSSLLPFCEICETPRKAKDQANTQKTSSHVGRSETTKLSSPVSLVEEAVKLSPPVCSSAQISKQTPHERRRSGKEQSVCGDDDDDDNEPTADSSTTRHKVKRNLVFGIGKAETHLENEGNRILEQSAQKSDTFSLRSCKGKNDADYCPGEAWRDKREQAEEDYNEDSKFEQNEDSQVVSFQLNSSFEREDGYTSPCLFDNEEEEEQDTLVMSDDAAEKISSFSSTESSHSCDTRSNVSVIEPGCSGSGSAKKHKSAYSHSASRSHIDSSPHADSDGETKEIAKVDSESGDSETDDFPKVQPPKRKSFMLGTPDKQCAGQSPMKSAGDLGERGSSKPDTGYSEENGNQTLEKSKQTPGKSKQTPEKSKPTPEKPKQTPEKSKQTPETSKQTPEKSKPTPEKSKPTHEKSKQTPEKSKPTPDRSKQTPEKPGQSRKRLASCDENETEESAAKRHGRLEGDGASSPSKQEACGHSNDCPTAAAGESSTVCGGQRTSSLCDSDKSGTVPHCDSPVLPQAGGEVHSSFMFCCSSYTGRVYLFDKEGGSLKANFLPLDVELDNVSQLPDILHHPLHLRLVQHFVRQWNSLTDTKRRLITKRGLKFHNPLAAYDTVRTDLANNKQRYQTKEEQARAAMKRAREVKGSVRVLSKRGPPSRLCVGEDQSSEPAGDGADVTTSGQGYVQAMSAEGTPLCIHCQQACSASVVSKDTSASNDMAWSTRFCSRVCADAHWMKTNTTYLRSSVYDVQHGVCQLCGLDAHTFFRQIRDGADRKQRAEKINSSKYCKLTAAQKKQMIARPYEGLFWHVDHIRPVWEGGGQCDMDNLRTLCTPCHLSVTAKQAAKRAQAHRLSKAAFAGDITAFFKKVDVSL